MQINIDIKGLEELQATMQNLPDRRINAICRNSSYAHSQAGTRLSTEEIQHGVDAGIISSTLLR